MAGDTQEAYCCLITVVNTWMKVPRKCQRVECMQKWGIQYDTYPSLFLVSLLEAPSGSYTLHLWWLLTFSISYSQLQWFWDFSETYHMKLLLFLCTCYLCISPNSLAISDKGSLVKFCTQNTGTIFDTAIHSSSGGLVVMKAPPPTLLLDQASYPLRISIYWVYKPTKESKISVSAYSHKLKNVWFVYMYTNFYMH